MRGDRKLHLCNTEACGRVLRTCIWPFRSSDRLRASIVYTTIISAV